MEQPERYGDNLQVAFWRISEFRLANYFITSTAKGCQQIAQTLINLFETSLQHGWAQVFGITNYTNVYFE